MYSPPHLIVDRMEQLIVQLLLVENALCQKQSWSFMHLLCSDMVGSALRRNLGTAGKEHPSPPSSPSRGRRGLRGSKMIPNDQYNMYLTIFNHLGLFWAHFDSFGSYQTKLDLLLKHFDRLAVCVFEAKNWFWCKKVQSWTNRLKMVPNGQRQVWLTIWDQSGPFYTTLGQW